MQGTVPRTRKQRRSRIDIKENWDEMLFDKLLREIGKRRRWNRHVHE